MKLDKIVNQLSTSVTIEDLKIQLPGPGSERTVSTEKADLSSDLARSVKAGEVKRFPVISPTSTSMSVWPFPKAQGKPGKSLGKPKEEPVVRSESPSEISGLKKEISELSSRLSQMIGLVEKGVSSLIQNGAQALMNPQYQASQRQGVSDLDDEPEPIFIPSKIVPDETRGRINVKSETEGKGNFEAAKKSLGAARKQAAKKPKVE